MEGGLGDGGGVAHGDVCVGVGGVADDKHLDGLLGVLVDGLALSCEDGSVRLEEVGAVHARTTGLGADEEAHISILEGDGGVGGADHLSDEGESTVSDLHGDTLEIISELRDVEETEANTLVGTEHLTLSDHEEDGICDISTSSRNHDVDRSRVGGRSGNRSNTDVGSKLVHTIEGRHLQVRQGMRKET